MIMILPIILPIICGFLLFVLRDRSQRERNFLVALFAIFNLSVVLLILKLGIKELHILTLGRTLKLYFKLDGLGVLFTLLVSVLWICTALYAFVYMDHEKDQNRFFIFFMCSLGVTLGVAFSGNLFTLYAFYEFLTLATFPMVIHAGTKEAIESGKKYLVYSFGGAALVLLGMIFVYGMTGNLDFVSHGLFQNMKGINHQYMFFTFLVMFIGFGVKAAVVPFHSWLPSAMVAPTPVSSLLHAAAVVKSGIFALLRLVYFIFGTQILKELNITLITSILAGVSILLGSILAMGQKNLKKRLAYSTVSQLGYITLGIVLLNEKALTGGLIHMINHAVIKITLFFCVGAILVMTHKKNVDELKGIGKEMPITMGCFTIASIALIGIPPTNGFVSKWYLALGALDANRILFLVVLLISAFLTASYLLPISIAAFFRGDEGKVVEKKDPPLMMLIPIVFLTGIITILGLFPNLLLHFIKTIVAGII